MRARDPNIATIFEDQPASRIESTWKYAENFISSYLLEVEVLGALRREGIDLSAADEAIGRLGYVQTRSLAREVKEVLRFGDLRGADLFHLATALWVRNKFDNFGFLSFDKRQADIAAQLGFLVP